MQIRSLCSTEVSLHRALRLRALKDTPDAFAESFEEVAARPMSYWEALTQSVTASGQHVMFLASIDEEVYGCTYGLLDSKQDDAARVGGMWVDPSQRKRGLGGALLKAVVLWAYEQQRTHMGLWAPTNHPEAVALYRRAGFVETGDIKPFPNQPSLQIMAMTLK